MCEPDDIAPYLAYSDVVDGHSADMAEQARRLADGGGGAFGIVRRSFQWVSNHIAHSMDCGAKTVPCSAGEVLAAGHGLCYAKCHLLAALLRANGIAAGFDYQRLGDPDGGYALHGLTTVYLPATGWIRLDSRGRANGPVNLDSPADRLLFPASGPGELNYRLNLAAPLPEVVHLLRRTQTLAAAVERLPGSVHMG